MTGITLNEHGWANVEELIKRVARTGRNHSGLYAEYIVHNADGSINVVKSIGEGYRKDPFEYMCSGDIHRMSTNDLDHFMIVGHVPCVYLEGESYRILRRKRYMCIDSGADPGCKELGGRLSMYCVDTDEEFYA